MPSPPRSNTANAVRDEYGYWQLLGFFEHATQEEIRRYADSFDADNLKILKKLLAKHAAPFRTTLVACADKAKCDPGTDERRALLRAFEHVTSSLGVTGAVYIRALHDKLPAFFKGKAFGEYVKDGHERNAGNPKHDEMMKSFKRVFGKTVKTRHSRSRSGSAASKGGGRSRRGRGRTRKNAPVAGFAVVQSKEKPWVKEPNYRRWLAKLRRHTAKVRKHGDTEHPDNLCVDSDICKGDLGIPRRLMPQFTTPRDVRGFMSFAERRYGVKSRRATRRAGQLRPSQEEINRERVEDVKEDIVAKKLNPNVPLIVSRDGYVIDGHHRWAAYKSHQPSKKMPVLVVGAPARDVLSIAATWGARHHQF
jgi:hypothetical protein